MNARSSTLFALAIAAAFGLARLGFGQAVGPADLNALTHEMAERVRRLSEDVASDLGRTPAGRHQMQDTQELAQAVDEFHETLHQRRDPIQVRQAYAGIESSWQHLRGR